MTVISIFSILYFENEFSSTDALSLNLLSMSINLNAPKIRYKYTTHKLYQTHNTSTLLSFDEYDLADISNLVQEFNF